MSEKQNNPGWLEVEYPFFGKPQVNLDEAPEGERDAAIESLPVDEATKQELKEAKPREENKEEK